MLSKPAAAPCASPVCGRPNFASAREERRHVRSLTSELAAYVKTMLPPALAEGGCVPRLEIGRGALTAASAAAAVPKTLRSTADAARRDAAVRRCAASGSCGAATTLPRRAPGIRTTVSERRSQQRADVVAHARKVCDDTASDVDALPLSQHLLASSGRMELVRQAAEVVFPVMIQAPLALHSPWSGLGGIGVAMASAPPVPPRIPVAPRMPQSMGMEGDDDEQFMGLVFPGFDANSFMWQITCWQAAEFVLSMVMGHNRANPLPCVLYRLGASWGPALARGQLWRLVTPVMLHANLTHLLFNVFFQLRMGFGMERQFGRTRMMLLYFACGIVGNLISVTLDPFKLAVGASTAGFGLIGVWFAEILLSWDLLGPARERTVIWIAFMLISVTTMSSMTPNMDLWGHFGGAFGGFLLSIVISDMKEEDRPKWYGQARAAAALALAIVFAGGLGKVMLRTPLDPIPNCPLIPAMGAAVATATS
eukprot:TRINITY_DN18433_c0_g1_i1.p1 TRINITY_DN18433_c0_g1~~TRINITY_DN18433_c0_g1_i1.p1  ORF type:complete len:480 (+),score=72.51 TRINITY_DN18433_c0_g1_i1:151-1590(+)